MILMGVVYGIVSAFVTLHFHWTAAALVPMAFLIVTGVGYSLIIGGMTLLGKRIQLLQETILMLVMIFAITALPLIAAPGWFTGIGRVFPVTADVASLYGVMLGHRGVTRLWGTGAWSGWWSPPPPTWRPAWSCSACWSGSPRGAAPWPPTDGS
jgi:ABC-2 type transport system permease protein